MNVPLCLAPGPTKVHPEIGQWLDEAEQEGVFWRSHRSSWFEQLYGRVKLGLREVLGAPDTHEIGFLASANEAWERSIQSLVEQESFHLTGGEFANRWHQFAQKLGRTPSRWAYTPHFSGDFCEVDVPSSAEAISLTLNETSTGFWIPESQLGELAAKFPHQLCLVDVVSAVPHTRMPWSSIDLAFWSVQKGFCLPAGLCVVVLSPRAQTRAEELEKRRGSACALHGLAEMSRAASKHQTTETPNVLGVYLVSRVLEKYRLTGADRLREQTAGKAEALYAGLAETPFRPLVDDPRYRSQTVVAVTADRPVEAFRKHLIESEGLYLGACYDEFKPNSLRIANFPSHTQEDHARALKALASF